MGAGNLTVWQAKQTWRKTNLVEQGTPPGTQAQESLSSP